MYRKGAANTGTDSISHLPTFGHTEIPPDLDIPCLAVKPRITVCLPCGKVDTHWWVLKDWDPVYDAKDERLETAADTFYEQDGLLTNAKPQRHKFPSRNCRWSRKRIGNANSSDSPSIPES